MNWSINSPDNSFQKYLKFMRSYGVISFSNLLFWCSKTELSNGPRRYVRGTSDPFEGKWKIYKRYTSKYLTKKSSKYERMCHRTTCWLAELESIFRACCHSEWRCQVLPLQTSWLTCFGGSKGLQTIRHISALLRNSGKRATLFKATV